MTRTTQKIETFCFCCGFPKARSDLGLTVMDQRAPEWQECTFANVTIHVCTQCWLERKEWLKAGIRGADEREKQYLVKPKLQGDFT